MINAKKAIVLGGQYGALSVTKALAQEGVNVFLLSPDPHGSACHSRFITQLFIIPNPIGSQAPLLEFLMERKVDWQGSLLIPTLDEYVIFISQNRNELRDWYVFTTQDWEITKKIINKNFLYSIAQEMGVPLPHFYLPDSVESLYAIKNEIVYPCIVKPDETYKFREIFKKKVLVIHDFQELTDAFNIMNQHHLSAMISEIIPGDDSSIFSYRSYIDRQGNLLAGMCTQKLRQYPAGFGQGSLVRTVDLIPEIRDAALMLLKSLSYYGESSAEFRLDNRDHKYKLMEINIRPVVTEWLFVAAGMNFPYMTYLDLVNNKRPEIRQYRQQLYWIHNHWELANLFISLKSGNLNIKEFLGPYRKDKVFLYPFFDDPIHFFIEVYLNARKLLRKTLQ